MRGQGRGRRYRGKFEEHQGRGGGRWGRVGRSKGRKENVLGTWVREGKGGRTLSAKDKGVKRGAKRRRGKSEEERAKKERGRAIRIGEEGGMTKWIVEEGEEERTKRERGRAKSDKNRERKGE